MVAIFSAYGATGRASLSPASAAILKDHSAAVGKYFDSVRLPGQCSYLCVSLLKNCTSDNTRVVILSLRIFVPVVRNFWTVLMNEIEAFVTNVFFVIFGSQDLARGAQKYCGKYF